MAKSNPHSMEHKMQTQFYQAHDGIDLTVHEWHPEDSTPRGIVQIAHGMCEHSLRYSPVSEFLSTRGWVVIASDHRGHGKTAANDQKGFISSHNGWDLLVNDQKAISERAREIWPDLPLFLLGHSMGSFVARDYAARCGENLAGLLISGTGAGRFSRLQATAGALVARMQRAIQGPRHPSRLMTALVFARYNSKISNPRTLYDWLSRDEGIVDRFIDDEDCGFVCSTSFYQDLMHGVRRVNSKKTLEATPDDLPILIFSGDRDPLGLYGKGIVYLNKQFNKLGAKHCNMQLYPGGRHEMLLEINRDDVFQDISKWLDVQTNR